MTSYCEATFHCVCFEMPFRCVPHCNLNVKVSLPKKPNVHKITPLK